MILGFALNDFHLFLKHPPAVKIPIELTEGGHMFIEELIIALFPTPKAVVCENSNTFDHLQGCLVWNIPYYKHTTAFGVEKEKSFYRTPVIHLGCNPIFA